MEVQRNQVLIRCPEADKLAKAVRKGNRELAIDLIKAGANPFDQRCENVEDEDGSIVLLRGPNAFDEASENMDIGLLLHMCAKAGSQWENRFLVSKNKTMLAPVHGRNLAKISMVRSVRNRSGPRNGLLRFEGATMEGLEALLMYGYKLTESDYATILKPYDFNEDSMEWKSLLAFALAVELPNIPASILNKLMSKAVGKASSSSQHLALVLLKSGASPNETHGPDDDDAPGNLLKALQNEDQPMVELLVKYGADAEADGVKEKAAEAGLQDLLVVDEDAVVEADPVAYVKQLRKQFMHGFEGEVKERSALLTVAVMRHTGRAPQKHLMSNLILQYCPLGFNLWKVETV